MSKKKKIVLIVLGVPFAILAVLFAAFWIWACGYHFEITESSWSGGMSTAEDFAEYDRLVSEGYVVSCPSFHNVTGFTADRDQNVYIEINHPLSVYASEIAKEYKSYAKLDYTVDVKPNETLTVVFTGTGYFYDDREPVPLGKTFVFDIKDISPEHLPTLLKEE